jgi:hypothetical protein
MPAATKSTAPMASSPLAASTSANEPIVSAIASNGAPVIEFPLTSFASTPHNVACIAFLLGGLWSVGLLSASNLFLTSKHLNWVSTSSSSLTDQTLRNTITSPILGVYLACWATFHLFEFLVTSMYNPEKLSVSCAYPSLIFLFSMIS